MAGNLKIGVLALQGAVVPHKERIHALGATPLEIRKPVELADISGIILPGGESTAMIHLLRLNQLWEPLSQFVKTKPTWGICAGAILLAREVTSPAQVSLEAMPIEVERNAYGRQSESFIAPLEPTESWMDNCEVEGVFIRAPRIKQISPSTKVLFRLKGEPVMIEEENCLASTFHPELTDNLAIHRYFLEKCITNGR